MISCRLKGGLGNLMFQIAGIESLSKKSNIKCGYYNVDEIINWINSETNHRPELKHANDYLKMFKNFNWPKIPQPKNKVAVSFNYSNIQVKDNTIYDGYFQSEKFFYSKEFIQWLFEPSDFVLNKLEKYKDILEGNTCALHVRRGDYLKFSSHVVKDMGYFNNAINIIKADKYLVFSDDIEWCKSKFIGSQYHFIENEKDYIEIFLQSKCKHNIISSSSFSWWGAYLNKNENKIIIAPSQWFTGGKFNSDDIVPENWIKI